MIEINLLPQDLRRKKGIDFSRIPKKKLIFAVFGSIVLLHLLFVFLTAINQKRLKSLNKTWLELSFKREKLQQLKQEWKELNTKVPLIEQLIRNRILWAEKLNRLSEALVSGVWLSELSLKTDEKDKFIKYLLIKGSCASRKKDEPALIGRFMQNLKEDPLFSADFAEIELGPIKKRLIKQTEVMDFILTCRFKPERATSLAK